MLSRQTYHSKADELFRIVRIDLEPRGTATYIRDVVPAATARHAVSLFARRLPHAIISRRAVI